MITIDITPLWVHDQPSSKLELFQINWIGSIPGQVLFPLIILGVSLPNLLGGFHMLCWSKLCWVLTEDSSHVSEIFCVQLSPSVLYLVNCACLGLLRLSALPLSSVNLLSLAPDAPFLLQSENFIRTVNWTIVIFISERVPFLRHHTTFTSIVKSLPYILFGFLVMIVASRERVTGSHLLHLGQLFLSYLLILFCLFVFCCCIV